MRYDLSAAAAGWLAGRMAGWLAGSSPVDLGGGGGGDCAKKPRSAVEETLDARAKWVGVMRTDGEGGEKRTNGRYWWPFCTTGHAPTSSPPNAPRWRPLPNVRAPAHPFLSFLSLSVVVVVVVVGIYGGELRDFNNLLVSLPKRTARIIWLIHFCSRERCDFISYYLL